MLSQVLARNIQKISFGFFIVLALAHLMSGLGAEHGYFGDMSGRLHRALFIPLVIVTLIYAFSTLKVGLMRRNHNGATADYAMIGIVALSFATLVLLEFIF